MDAVVEKSDEYSSSRAPGYRICSRCVMDTTDPDISFDENGCCNHCNDFFLFAPLDIPSPDRSETVVAQAIREIKSRGNSEYDCIVGLSGGADSSYLAYVAVQRGLRPLAVHLDNGWNSELAIKNIQEIVSKLDIDLFTYVLDWSEFKDLQLAFLRASVVDIEMLTDHAITALLYRQALERGIPSILSGSNFTTEAIMPRSWSHRKSDLRNLRAIHRRFGTVKLERFPTASTLRLQYYGLVRKIQKFTLLDQVGYDKERAIATLGAELGWRYYGGKHYESTFTRFYQSYILPTKFGIDKRRAHLSTLICAGQLDRAAALEELRKPPYNEASVTADKEYVAKKLGLTVAEFDEIMSAPPRSHYDYPTEESYLGPLLRRRHGRKRAVALSAGRAKSPVVD